MADAKRRDPLPAYCFKVDLKLSGAGDGGLFFKSVSGLKYETETVDIKEGGVNNATWKAVGATKWANLIFKRGFTKDSEILAWRAGWMDGSKMTRVSGTITQLDSALKPVATWSFVDAWPCKWELSELDAGKNEVAIETLELAHHGLTFKAQ